MRRRTIAEKPIKVDAQTDRLVSELAYYLGCTKKSVVRDAVADFAEATRGGDRGEASERPSFDRLPLLERLTLRRRALIREFAGLGATNIRVIGPLAFGEHADEIELLAETDLLRGSASAPELQAVAVRLLAATSTVISTTELALFNPERLRRFMSESRPL